MPKELKRGHLARDQSNCVAVNAVEWLCKVWFQRELQPGSEDWPYEQEPR